MNAAHEPTQEQIDADLEREKLIDAWTVILMHETDHEYQCTAMRRQRELINERSQERIKQMEEERGLA